MTDKKQIEVKDFYNNIGIYADCFIDARKIKAYLYGKPEDFIVGEILSRLVCGVERGNVA